MNDKSKELLIASEACLPSLVWLTRSHPHTNSKSSPTMYISNGEELGLVSHLPALPLWERERVSHSLDQSHACLLCQMGKDNRIVQSVWDIEKIKQPMLKFAR